MGPTDRNEQHANPHGFTIDDNGKTHDIKPTKKTARAGISLPSRLDVFETDRLPKRCFKRSDNPRGVSLGGQDIDKETRREKDLI